MNEDSGIEDDYDNDTFTDQKDKSGIIDEVGSPIESPKLSNVNTVKNSSVDTIRKLNNQRSSKNSTVQDENETTWKKSTI